MIIIAAVLVLGLVLVLAAAFWAGKENVDDVVLYGGILVLIFVIVVGALVLLGPTVTDPFSTINRSLTGV